MFRISFSSILLHSCSLGSNVRQKPIKIGEGSNSILISFTSPIRSWSGGAKVEVEAKFLLILPSRILSELTVELEKIVITTP